MTIICNQCGEDRRDTESEPWFAVLSEEHDHEKLCCSCLLEQYNTDTINITLEGDFTQRTWDILMSLRINIPQHILRIGISEYLQETNQLGSVIKSNTFDGVRGEYNKKLDDTVSLKDDRHIETGAVPYEALQDKFSLSININNQFQSIRGLSFETLNNTYSGKHDNLYAESSRKNISEKTCLYKNGPTCYDMLCDTSSRDVRYIRPDKNEYSFLCENCQTRKLTINITDIDFKQFVTDTSDAQSYYKFENALGYTITYETVVDEEEDYATTPPWKLYTPNLTGQQVVPWFEGTVETDESDVTGRITPMIDRSRRSIELQGEKLTETVFIDVPDNFESVKAKLTTPSVNSKKITYNIQCDPQIWDPRRLVDRPEHTLNEM